MDAGLISSSYVETIPAIVLKQFSYIPGYLSYWWTSQSRHVNTDTVNLEIVPTALAQVVKG